MISLKLFDRLPEGVKVGRRFFRCDFDFRNVLKMLEIMQRDDITPLARDYLCARCVILRRIGLKTASEAYKALCDLLFEKPAEQAEKRLVSFGQDAGLIRAAFRQVYGIDLYRERLTWFEFMELFQGLPDGNRFEDVVNIRARPLPEPNKYTNHEILKSPLVTEYLLQQPVVSTAGVIVKSLICTHHFAHFGILHQRLKCRQVSLP